MWDIPASSAARSKRTTRRMHRSSSTRPSSHPANTYPITIEQDPHKSEELGGVRAVFLLGVKGIYPSGISQDVGQQRGMFVDVKRHGEEMEGHSRPLLSR